MAMANPLSSSLGDCLQPNFADSAAVCGAAVAASGHCVAHLDPHERAIYLATLTSGAPINARGVVITRDLQRELLLAAPRDSTGEHPQFRDADFSDATFAEEADFYSVAFIGDANFRGATFTTEANFRSAAFIGDANFESATFAGKSFFLGTTVAGHAAFNDATFIGDAVFIGTSFAAGVHFAGTTFAERASFNGVAVTGEAGWRATFSRQTEFREVVVTGRADFGGSKITEFARLMLTATELRLAGVEVVGELVVEAAAQWVDATAMRATGRVTLRLRNAHVDLANGVFTSPMTVHGLQQPIPDVDESLIADPETGQVRSVSIASLRGLDAEQLALTDVDLSHCLFAGMHRLDQIKLDGRCTFDTDPRRHRQVLAEERHWRTRGESAPDHVDVIGPARLEVLYRQLRKALEDSKNEPGAADFYYGEMEMRRANATRSDRWLLNLYWATSGYALRPRRALACLAILISATIIALTAVGFPANGATLTADGTLTTPTGNQPIHVTIYQSDPVKDILARTEKATEITLNAVIFRAPDTQLTTTGRYINITARILGPLLLGLALIAIRNRVKR